MSLGQGGGPIYQTHDYLKRLETHQHQPSSQPFPSENIAPTSKPLYYILTSSRPLYPDHHTATSASSSHVRGGAPTSITQ